MPAPAGDGLPAIPLPEPRKTPRNKDGKDDLPPIVLPPEGTGTSSGVIPSTSRSSPLTGAIKTQVFAASGGAVAGTLRKIGFFNHTNRDLELVIEGRTVTLPLLQPVLLVVILLRLIDAARIFDKIFIMTRGGPGSSAYTATLTIYIEGFTKFDFGYASALSFLFQLSLVAAATFYVKRVLADYSGPVE